ncbi:ActS/PrrB/RegB family redox-sensitive histidine kinase [Rhodobacter sp. KR11]|jgi:two-component system sensor histidine kinase RegB|uniref:sensor histidine kinase RegB n=1 Tax=Rhodobacter sp. KR11 TaxID=2974588 RepID=UPI0022224570|nr:ActS/PrrB/RegB family redox-sensitive histidine kinase [Rhodobacter sp. KR11]MCW1918878.1 ActS/PrrB/RegB family redox-sensitive histidine kinase [Rhodobacter sp. KR11]
MDQLPGPSARDFSEGQWVRLRTLTTLRWFSVVGQVAVMTAAHAYFGLILPIDQCALAVGAAVALNIISATVFPGNRRLADHEAMLLLLFDLIQLIYLVGMTGGLDNPFILLVIVPVTISASALELKSTVFLGGLAVQLVTAVAFVYKPLRFASGEVVILPRQFEVGFWLAVVSGTVFIAIFSRRIAVEMRAMADALLATQMALSREQKLTDLGGVVAAAAHELGTPLATIKMVATELVEELEGDAREDAMLIRAQADRCRDILRDMGRAGKDDLHLRQAPLIAVVNEAAEPHMDRGKKVEVVDGIGLHLQPRIWRRPEVIHGLRNLIQNAVDFAAGKVWVDLEHIQGQIRVRIVDDGDGFPFHVLYRIGDPFVSNRRVDEARPGYEGMGLGLFIAKTLLERTGAVLTFANASDPFSGPGIRPERSGAVVEVVWPESALLAEADLVNQENRPMEI